MNGATSNISNIPAVVTSYDKQAYFSYQDDGVKIANASATNVDEVVNGSNAIDTTYYTRDFTKNTASTGGEFDDLVVWISAIFYINRMVSAGQLP
jgi:hypothetical protein